MMTPRNNTSVSLRGSSLRRSRKAIARLSAAGALIALLFSGAAAGAEPATQPSADATTQPSAAKTSFVTDGLGTDGSLHLIAGKGAVLTTRSPYKRLSVGQPEVADVSTIGPSNVLVSAKKAGSTQIILWDDQDRSQVVDVVVDLDLAAAQRQLKAAFPDARIEASALNDHISLRGQVPSLQMSEQAVEMISAYGKVNNFMEVSGGQQVMLQVRFAEVSKTASRNLGVNFGGTDGVSQFATAPFGGGTTVFPGNPPPLFTYTPGSANLFGVGRAGATSFDYFITALQQNGLVRVLAEPNLVATSGQDASFLAGGQIPIPVPQPGNGGSTITIEYRDFGVRLNFTPIVLGNGRIRLKVSPEVSDLDFSSAVNVAGTSVPGFTVRKLNTVVELSDGQSFALAGLLNNKVTANKSGIPLLGDIPVLGALFRSVSYQRSETELVVVVTPRLVEAMNPDQVTSLPGEHWRYPDPLKFYGLADLGGPQVEQGKADVDKSKAKAAAAAPPPQFHGSYGYTPVGAGNATATAQ